jgi:hypothetical protein
VVPETVIQAETASRLKPLAGVVPDVEFQPGGIRPLNVEDRVPSGPDAQLRDENTIVAHPRRGLGLSLHAEGAGDLERGRVGHHDAVIKPV